MREISCLPRIKIILIFLLSGKWNLDDWKSGEEIELHHIGQKPDNPLAELTLKEHRGIGNDGILHDKTKETEINRIEFAKERRDHWKGRIEAMEGA